MTRTPEYYETFQCLAGQCPHSCCEAWEVVLDGESVQRYRCVEGELGEKLRRAMVEVEGEVCFALRGGRCPFLDGENLCEIHRVLGEEATSITCQSHPRFIEEYGQWREITLAASCPAANNLLLESGEPLRFVVTEEGGDGDEDAKPFFALREAAFGLLQDRRYPLKRRLGWLLALGCEAQWVMDEEGDEALYALAADAEQVKDTAVDGKGEPLFPAALEVLGELEVLGADWPELLAAGRNTPGLDIEANAPALERICAYFLFRYLCKAVNDGDLLSRVQLALLGTLTAARLGGVQGLGEALRIFSREVEHSEENLERLQEAFCFDARVAPERFFAVLA